MKRIVTMVDPPSGWKYGFPKILPESAKGESYFTWLISEGYPQAEIDNMGDHFYSRYWDQEVDEDK